MPSQKNWPPKLWLIVAILVTGMASVVALGVMTIRAIEKVKSGHGLDTYRTAWLVEYNHIGFLVLLAGIAVAMLIDGVLRFREYRQRRELEKKYGSSAEKRA